MIIEYEYEIKVRHSSTVDIDDEHKQLFIKEYGCEIEQATDEQLYAFVNKHKIYHYEDLIEDSDYWAKYINEKKDMTLLNVKKSKEYQNDEIEYENKVIDDILENINKKINEPLT